MTTLLKLTLVALVVAFMVTTTSVSIQVPTANADPCTPGTYDYNPYTCAQINPSLCAQNPAYCSNTTSNYYQLYCIPGTPSYSAVLCQSYSGNVNNQYYTMYCTPGSATYNLTLCQQYGGTANAGQYYQLYCIPTTATYNAALCQQYGGQYGTTNTQYYQLYCQVGTANYNAQLCAQYGGQTNQASIYCQVGTASYNAQLCAQYSGQQVQGPPATIYVNSASNSLNCNGSMSLVIAVASSAQTPVADGTAVSLSASAGQVSPASGTTSGGTMTALYSAGSASGTATITATAGGINGTKSVTINCGTTTTTSPSTTQPPSQPVYTSPPPPPPGGNIIIAPPNTGDGGLLPALQTED